MTRLRTSLRAFFRHFRRFRTTYLLHLTGLSIGLASALLIGLWVTDEWSVDRFHQNDSRLFRVLVNWQQANHVITTSEGGGVMETILKKDLPEVEYAVSMTPPVWFANFTVSAGTGNGSAAVAALPAAGNFVGEDFFKAFSFPLSEGNKATVLTGRQSIVISKGLAQRLFHTTRDLIGKVVIWKWLDFSKPCMITGVYDDFPANSTMRFDFVLPLEAWKDLLPPAKDQGPFNPSGGPFFNYVVVREGTSLTNFHQKMTGYIRERWSKSKASLFPQKYSDHYLHGRFENGQSEGGRIGTVRMFALIAVFILVMACINFTNLSTANASRRMKEVGVKKTLGASRGALIRQFLGESLLTSLAALLIALVLVIFLLPAFNQITGKQIHLRWNTRLVLSIPLLALLTGLLAGSYPALYLSRLRPVMTLKGIFSGSALEVWVRRGLVVFQFTLSILFIVGVIVVYRQIQFIQSTNPGYNRDNVLYFEKNGQIAHDPAAFIARLKRLPGVVNASSIGSRFILPEAAPSPGTDRTDHMAAGYDLIETLGIRVVEGRSFSRDFGSDTTAVLINEREAAAIGMPHPVGRTIDVFGHDKQIIGVVKDFHFNSLHEAIHPFIFRLEPEATFFVIVKINSERQGETIRRIETLYKEHNPGLSFVYGFLDADYQAQYASDRLTATLARYFAGLAILISCLGLFGLAAFTAERRGKEIGVRKILGAGVLQIVWLLSAEFTKIVVLALLIALPLSYWVTQQWLNGFAYRIALHPGYFAAAALAALLTAWGTIGIRTVRVAMQSPLAGIKEGS